jgi:hypothetical protein
MKEIDETEFFSELMKKLGLTDKWIKSITIKIGYNHSPYILVEKFINQEEADGLKEVLEKYMIEKIEDGGATAD